MSSSTQITNSLAAIKTFAQNYIKRVASGAGNLGGAIDGARTEISDATIHAFWSKIDQTRATAGGIRFRCFYIYNSHDSLAAINPVLYVSQQTASPNDEIMIGLGSSGLNGVEQTIANEFTTPANVNFVSGVTRTTGLVLGTAIPPLGYYPIWVQQTIQPNAETYPYDTYKLRLEIQDPSATYIPPVQDVTVPILCAVGNMGINAEFDTILSKMKARKGRPNVTLGDNSYLTTGTDWFAKLESAYTAPLAKGGAFYMCFGDEDWSATTATHSTTELVSLVNQYENYFGYSNPYNAVPASNVYILTVHANTGVDVSKTSAQYAFVKNRLLSVAATGTIDWLIVCCHFPMYFGKTASGIVPKTSFATDYAPLFEAAGVQLYLFAHANLYTRFGVLKYNTATPTAPTELLSGQAPNYSYSTQTLGGVLHIGVGTGGAVLHGFADHVTAPPAYEKQRIENTAGYLYLETLNNGKKLHGVFYDQNDILLDEWSISKQ